MRLFNEERLTDHLRQEKKNRRSILYDQLRIDQLTLRRVISFYQCDLCEVNVNSGNRYHIYNVFASWFTSKG